jgi:hypothetical protein
MKLGTCIMAAEPISTAYLINPSHQSMCIPPFDARQRLDKHVPAATDTRNNRTIVGRVIFCEVCVLSKESQWVYLCILHSLLGNKSVKTLPRQQRVVGGVVFYAIRVESKNRLVLHRNSRYSFILPSLSLYFYVIKVKLLYILHVYVLFII